MNIFTGLGRLTRDPELKTTQTGLSVCSFTVAINRRFKGTSGKYESDFLSCISWRQTGEFIARNFRKGSMIGIVGSVQTRNYDDKEGKKRYATEIIVDQAYFAGAKPEPTGETAPPQIASEAAPAVKDDGSGFFPEADEDSALPFDI